MAKKKKASTVSRNSNSEHEIIDEVFDAEGAEGEASDSGAAISLGAASEDADDLRDFVAARESLIGHLGGDAAFVSSAASAMSVDEAPGMGNIQGVGIGYKSVLGVTGPERCVRVYVRRKFQSSALSDKHRIPTELAGIPTDIRVVGSIRAFQFDQRFATPVPSGISVGHPLVTAGTLGCSVQMRDGRRAILSNNHVLAAVDQARIGDPILQPGPQDGGAMGDRIANLAEVVPINFFGPNTVDAAVAATNKEAVDPDMVLRVNADGTFQKFSFNPTPTAARLRMEVMKTGRTTEFTTGTITDIGARNLSVRYRVAGGRERIAMFNDVLGIQGGHDTPVFSRGGDSGSLILSFNGQQPVGLLFAGDDSGSAPLTFANSIQNVINALGIRQFLT